MVIHTENISKILERNEMLRTYVNTLAKSVDQCSNDTPSEMRLAKGHLDFIHYSLEKLDTQEYNDINNLLSDLGMTFKKCKCE
jgi:hypothetical protein